MPESPLLRYRVGLVGCPTHPHVEWTADTANRLRDVGFNTVQVNIAWSGRPGGDPLNLEDVVALPPALEGELGQPVPLDSDQSSGAFEWRRAELTHRLSLAHAAGLITIFHFGAPYNGHLGYADRLLPNCLLDGRTPRRYEVLVRELARAYPAIDHLLIYTYDQHAWLCNEFGECPRCRGVPLHQRVVPFLHRLGRAWRETHPEGRLWWEPWELSAGQALACIEHLDPEVMGLALHSTIAEVIVTMAVDRYVRNACGLARERGIPVILEGFLGAASEELEPFIHLSHPLVTLRQLRTMSQVDGVSGIKEYYGLLPEKEDPNLRATQLFFADPAIDDAEALDRLAAPYGDAAAAIAHFWALTSQSMELYPWDASWFARLIGTCNPSHSMQAAFVRGQNCHTPGWAASRGSIFMVTNNEQPDPWLLEDLQLRFALSAARMKAARAAGIAALERMPEQYREGFARGLDELHAMEQRVNSYVYHLHETNIATSMRLWRRERKPVPPALIHELADMLRDDQQNQGQEEPIASALRLLERDIDEFLAVYFRVPTDDAMPRGAFSLTSR